MLVLVKLKSRSGASGKRHGSVAQEQRAFVRTSFSLRRIRSRLERLQPDQLPGFAADSAAWNRTIRPWLHANPMHQTLSVIRAAAARQWARSLSGRTNLERAEAYLREHGIGPPRKAADEQELRTDDVRADGASKDPTQADQGTQPHPVKSVAHIISLLRDEGGGIDVASVNITDKSSVASHLVLCTARTPPHAYALAEMLERSIRTQHVSDRKVNYGPRPVRGSDWIAVDAGSVVAHIMLEEVRNEYDLKGLWSESLEAHAEEAPSEQQP